MRRAWVRRQKKPPRLASNPAHLAEHGDEVGVHLDLEAAARREHCDVAKDADRLVGGRRAGLGVLQHLVQQHLRAGHTLMTLR